MKKILIKANSQPTSQAIAFSLRQKLAENALMEVEPQSKPDYLISIGGDGTLISAFHNYQKWIEDIQFIGIHTGHLGFYTDWLSDELDELVAGLVHHQSQAISYPLLEVSINETSGKTWSILALNEASIRSVDKTMVCDVNIKEYFFETFRGDGLCIATPTGSTGLNKSLGGAIIHPRLDALQMTEIASVNNRVFRTLASPIVLAADEWFDLRLHDKDQELNLLIDNLSYKDLRLESLQLRLAKQRIHFASIRHMHFWDRVESSFIGHKETFKNRD